MLVPLGFRVRPLRDGGGKTSPGRVPPPLRSPTPLAEKGRLILTKVQSLTKDFLHSINKHEKHHPFSDDLLRDVRQILVGPTNETVTPGQPFYLDAIHEVAKQLQDADRDYPLTVKDGVPLGVTSPTLTSPGIWPTKAELKGEDPTLIDLPYPTGRANYSSAEQFTEDIKTTFREERALQMVEGPFTTTEADTAYTGSEQHVESPHRNGQVPRALIPVMVGGRAVMDGGCQTLHHGPWVPAQVRWWERFALFVGFWAMVACHAFPVSQVEVWLFS